MAASSDSGDRPERRSHQGPEDASLLLAAARGEESSFRLLVERHGPYLYGVARSLIGHDADAEDLVQETLAGVLGAKFRGEASARTWLVQVLVRRAAMLRRARGRERRALPTGGAPRRGDWEDAAPSGGRGAAEPGRPPPAGADLPRTAAASGGVEARLDLAFMLGSLPPDQRQVVVLRELEGLSYEEIAATLNVPRGTVESRLHRARLALREKFGDYFRAGP